MVNALTPAARTIVPMTANDAGVRLPVPSLTQAIEEWRALDVLRTLHVWTRTPAVSRR